jgi:hypothetical protein
MAEQLEEKVSFDGTKVKVLAGEFEAGKPDKKFDWRAELRNREEMLAYLRVGVR